MAAGPIEEGKLTRTSVSLLLLALAYVGFISLGLPDAVTGIAWPEIRQRFDLTQGAFGLISLALGSGYFLSSFLAGQLTQRLGIGLLLTASSLFVALAMFGNAAAPSFIFILFCVTLWGLGSGAIDAGLNHYAASHFSARHVNWLHACYSLGATLGPLVMTATIVLAQSWRLGYVVVGSVVLTLTILFAATMRQWDDGPGTQQSYSTSRVSMRAVLRRPLVWLQIAIFFLYTGLEFMVGNWTFTLLTESRGVRADHAGLIVGGYYGAIGVGRVLLGGLADNIGVDRLLRGATLAAVGGTLLFAFSPWLILSIAGLAILGLGLAPIFPCLMSRTPARLGTDFAAHAIGFQVSAATIGGAAIPALAGQLAQRVSLESVAALSVILAVLILVLHEGLFRGTRSK
jgi:fucose permease